MPAYDNPCYNYTKTDDPSIFNVTDNSNSTACTAYTNYIEGDPSVLVIDCAFCVSVLLACIILVIYVRIRPELLKKGAEGKEENHDQGSGADSVQMSPMGSPREDFKVLVGPDEPHDGVKAEGKGTRDANDGEALPKAAYART